MNGRALCLICGRSGPIVGQSLDPAHPFMECRWESPDHLVHGHGRVLGTLSVDESDAIQIAKRERRLTFAHGRDAHRAKRNAHCPLCQAAVPSGA